MMKAKMTAVSEAGTPQGLADLSRVVLTLYEFDNSGGLWEIGVPSRWMKTVTPELRRETVFGNPSFTY